MSDPFEYGDPYIEWNEENSAKEEGEEMDLEGLKDDVVKLLVSNHSFLVDEAEEAVDKSVQADPDLNMWHENAIPEDLAKYLASDDNDD